MNELATFHQPNQKRQYVQVRAQKLLSLFFDYFIFSGIVLVVFLLALPAVLLHPAYFVQLAFKTQTAD